MVLTGLAGCLGGNDGNDGNGGGGSGGGGGGGGGESRSLSIATPFNPEHTQTKLASRFADNVDSATDGRITFDVLAASVGGEEDQIEAVASGTVDMHGTSISSVAAAYGPEYGFLEAPFVAQNWDHFVAMQEEYTYADGGFNEKIINQGNQRQLSESFRGLRGTTSNKVVKHPDDVQGLDMRLPQFETWVKTWQEIGVNATPVAFDELYSALETGVVEASEGPIQQFMDTSLYEVQTHFSETQHLLQGLSWLINEALWQDLSSDDQQMIQESLDEAIEWANEETRSEVDVLLKKAEEEHGTTITRAEDVDQEAFVEAGRPQLERFFENRWDPSFEEVMGLA
ncbi:TRAP transporter substrate-binding protein [Halomarina halobia]|uniref:TRAP transporter substrate-binding protein n=1 Tax=Halomarina halobia TaxID=3033386 RepID=A0ABD6AEC8_9EURY|nr:TRAP transporter substrate-binding protein [Halomarina sp. PSR21]